MGEGGRHVTLTTEIVRQYLADVDSSLPLTLTNAELLVAIRSIPALPVAALTQLLEASDAVRFSGTRTDADVVRRVSALAREVVRDVEQVRSASTSEAA